MGSIFSGLSEVLGSSNTKPNASSRKRGSERIMLGHVLDVVLDETSPYYNSEYGIGAIRFRAIPEDYQKDEKSINTFATPADRSKYQVPLPGEQVLIYPIVLGNRLSYAYGSIIKQSLNIAYNSEPFTSTTPFYIDKNMLNALVDEASLATRFKDKLQIPYEDYENSSYGVMSLREGDMIFEGRFGSSILFTSTMDKIVVKDAHSDMHIGDDDFSKQQTTEDGDPALIIQANKKLTANDPYLIKPSINKADSIVYMTSTQIIPMEVATSKRMDSWNVTVTRPKVFKLTEDLETTRLQATFDGAYDPNVRFQVNLNVTGFVGGSNFGATGTQTPFTEGDKKAAIMAAFTYLKTTGGLGETQAAGLIGNLLAESSLRPMALERPSRKRSENSEGGKWINSGGGAGIAQWTGGRRTKFETFMGVANLDPVDNKDNYLAGLNSFDSQMAYLVSEIKSSYKSTWTVLTSPNTTIEEATITVLERFEVPATYLHRNEGATGAAGYQETKNKRIGLAQQALSTYKAG